MAAIDASLGQFKVFYPAALQEAEGAVDAQCMVSWDDKSISTRAFTIRVEPVLVGGDDLLHRDIRIAPAGGALLVLQVDRDFH